MTKFPVDAPKRKVIKALEILGFRIVWEREHVSMIRENLDGSKIPLTMPNQQHNDPIFRFEILSVLFSNPRPLQSPLFCSAQSFESCQSLHWNM